MTDTENSDFVLGILHGVDREVRIALVTAQAELAAERKAHERVALSESRLVQCEIELRNQIHALETDLDTERERNRQLVEALQCLCDEWIPPGICNDCNHTWCKNKRNAFNNAMALAYPALAKNGGKP